MQFAPHAMPAGWLVTVPLPLLATVSLKEVAVGLIVKVTPFEVLPAAGFKIVTVAVPGEAMTRDGWPTSILERADGLSDCRLRWRGG